MICAVNDPQRQARFLAALQGQDFPAVQLGAHWQAFGGAAGSGWQFYTGAESGQPFALSVKGASAQCCGPCDPVELGSFLGFLGIQQLIWRGPAPAGYRPDTPMSQFVLKAGQQLPGGRAEDRPSQLELVREPPFGPVTRLVMEEPELSADGQDFYDEFYARGCTLRNRGLAQVWTLQQQDGTPAATAGIYGLWQGRGYLAAVHTRQDLRGQGLSSWLVSALANDLARQGLDVGLWCQPELIPFYTRMGFAACEPVPRYIPEE